MDGSFESDFNTKYSHSTGNNQVKSLANSKFVVNSQFGNAQREMYPEPVDFSEYQRKMWYSLSQGAVSRFYHIRDSKTGSYVIKQIGFFPLTFYWFMWTNTVIKVTYLILSYRGWLGVRVGFLDQMSMWDWYLSTTHMVQEQVMWYPKYPMYENLHAQWTVQEAIFARLGRPVKASKSIHRTDWINTFYYPFVVFFGTFALGVQFFFTPKYALNTYAVVPESWDTAWLQIIFCIHECLFMYHAYAYQACTMVVAESMSTSYQHLLEEMTKTTYLLIRGGQRLSLAGIKEIEPEEKSQDPAEPEALKKPRRTKKSAYRRQIMKDSGGIGSGVYRKVPIRRYLDPLSKAPGTSYDILTLIHDYKKIILCANEHNKWIGKWMGGAQAANYAQFVSDVFLMIQLLKEPEFDLFGISFYVMDACFGMCMLFRMLIILSRLVPASEEFIHSIKCYAMYETGLRKYIMKVIPSLKIVSAKLTGMTVSPDRVPTGVNVLINWYIAAAMWKRPDDPSRRT